VADVPVRNGNIERAILAEGDEMQIARAIHATEHIEQEIEALALPAQGMLGDEEKDFRIQRDAEGLAGETAVAGGRRRRYRLRSG
jgi:hypothetical protein